MPYRFNPFTGQLDNIKSRQLSTTTTNVTTIYAVDWNTADEFDLTMTADTVFSFSNLNTPGRWFEITVRGIFTPTWPTVVWPPNGTPAYADNSGNGSQFIFWCVKTGEIRGAMVQGSSLPSTLVYNNQSNTYTGNFIQLITETNTTSGYFAINKSGDTASTYRAIYSDIGMGLGPGSATVDTLLVRTGVNALTLENFSATLGTLTLGTINATTAVVSTQLQLPAGSVGTPPIYFGNNGASIYSSGTNALDFATNGTDRWRIGGGGNFVPQTDNTYSIGSATGPLTVKDHFMKGTLYINKTVAGTVEKFGINTPGTTDNTTIAIITTGADANKGLVIQRNSSSQSANLFETQGQGGTILTTIDGTGAISAASTITLAAAGGTGYIDFTPQTTLPSTPSTTGRIYVANKAARPILYVEDSAGLSVPMQSAMFGNTVLQIYSGTQSGNIGFSGGQATLNGTSSIPTPSETLGLLTQCATSGGANANSGVQSTNKQFFRGSGTAGGAFYATRIYMPDASYDNTGASTGSRIFCGFSDQTFAITLGSDDPAGNRAGFSRINVNGGVTDGNWFFSTKDNATETRTDTSMAFTVQHIYDLYIWMQPNGNVSWQIDDITAGTTQASAASTHLPSGTAGQRSMLGLLSVDAVARNIDFRQLTTTSPR